MKCSYCGKEINEMTEKYHVYTLDGDFIHDDCEIEYRESNQFAELIKYIEESPIDELTEFLKSNDIKFENNEIDKGVLGEVKWLDAEKKKKFKELDGCIECPIDLAEMLMGERWKDESEED